MKQRSEKHARDDGECNATVASQATQERNGAESLDAAREKWWIGLPDPAAADYDRPHEARNEPLYRSGFQAGLEPDLGETTPGCAAS